MELSTLLLEQLLPQALAPLSGEGFGQERVGAA